MIKKDKEKQKAIQFRKKGFSYSEILKEIPVAKSTLSLWLGSVNLTKKQKRKLTERGLQAAKRGGEKKRQQRIEITKRIEEQAADEINRISQRELWLIGVILYCAEGSKQKEWNKSQGVELINSDPFLIKLFLKWLFDIIKLSLKDIKFEIYIHENYNNKEKVEEVKIYWSKVTGLRIDNFKKIFFKKHKIKTVRKRVDSKYYGILKIKVKASTNLNRRINGWIKGIEKRCRVV